MTKEQWDAFLSTIKEIFAVISIAATGAAVFYGGMQGWLKSKADLIKTRSESASLDVNTQTRRRLEAVDLVDKMTEVNLKLIASMEDRFDQLSKELETARNDLHRRDVLDREVVARAASTAADKAAVMVVKSLGSVQVAVEKVGEKADAAYEAANNSALKLQQVQNEITTALNMPRVAITEKTGAVEPEEKKE